MNALDIRVLDTVREQIAAVGYPPTGAELSRMLDEPTSSVHRAIDRLDDSGQLKRDKRKHRGLALGDQPDLRSVPTEAMEMELGRRGITFRALSRIEPMRPTRGAPCAATVCDQLVQRGHLFCRRHWFVIPRDVQDRIMQAFGRRDAVAYEQALTYARDLIDGYDDGFRRIG